MMQHSVTHRTEVETTDGQVHHSAEVTYKTLVDTHEGDIIHMNILVDGKDVGLLSLTDFEGSDGHYSREWHTTCLPDDDSPSRYRVVIRHGSRSLEDAQEATTKAIHTMMGSRSYLRVNNSDKEWPGGA